MNCGGIRTIYRTRQVCICGARERILVGVLRIPDHRVVVIHVVVVPDGFEIVTREGVGVKHPPECLRNESAAGGVALFLRRNTEWSENWPPIPGLVIAFFLTQRRDAPVH